MKRIMMMTLLSLATATTFAQTYMTRTGKVTFFSSTPVENIEAFNNEAAAVLDGSKGNVMFELLIKSFKFEKALMQEHFNENYMESDKYPKATFKGQVANIQNVNFSKNSTYNVTATGKLTMHGVTRDVSVPGTITVKDGSAIINTKFKVKPADYGIKIPAMVASKIAEQIEVTVETALTPKK